MLDNDYIYEIMFGNPLIWDKKNYKFNRDEKDMKPFSIKHTETSTIIVHNVLGIEKKDLKLTLKTEKDTYELGIEGKTVDSVTGKEYSVSSTFTLDEKQLDLTKINSNLRNGLIYIIIPRIKNVPKKDKTIKIDIL